MDQDLGSKISIVLFVSFQLSEFFLNIGCQVGLLIISIFKDLLSRLKKKERIEKNKNNLICSVVWILGSVQKTYSSLKIID